MKPVTVVKLSMEPLAFVAIYSILREVQLGNRNLYEEALSDLMIEMEEDGAENLVNTILEDWDMVAPELNASANSQDGLTLQLT